MRWTLILGLAVVAGALLLAAPALRSEEPAAPAGAEPARRGGTLHPVTIRPAGKPAAMATGELDALGVPVVVSCSACHSLRVDETPAETTAGLTKFHKDFEFDHGDRACLACHNPGDYDTLRMADGKAILFSQSMQLCGQCHGTQARDYVHGAHGGMSGHWDLTRGPRVRNQCVHCHDPHVPAFPRMHPTFKPRDRFLDGQDAQGAHDER